MTRLRPQKPWISPVALSSTIQKVWPSGAVIAAQALESRMPGSGVCTPPRWRITGGRVHDRVEGGLVGLVPVTKPQPRRLDGNLSHG